MPRIVILALTLIALASPSASLRAAHANRDRAAPAHSRALPTVPAGWVTDLAGIIGPAQEARLTETLERFARMTQHQLVIVTVPALGEQDIATLTRDLGRRWGIGRKGYDDGIVLLVAPTEQKARIAVGYGLERRLPDSLCQKIMDRKMMPRFRVGDIAGGIEAGTDALIAVLH